MRNIISHLIFLLALLFLGINSYAQNPCPNPTATNLITNGDFSSGNTGFTSPAQTYSSGSPPSLAPGGYAIWTNPNQTNSYYASMGDHTTGSGNMLIVDVNGTVGSVVYQTTVSVTSGSTYFFSAWFANINGTYQNSPILKFSINGTAVGAAAYVDSTDHNWKQFFTSYKATTTGSISIQIENDRSGSNGNDLALDDIYFAGGCANISNLSAFGSNATVPDLYECDYSFPHGISSGLANSGSGFTFQWKNSSLAVLGTSNTLSFATAPAAGKYYLCYDTAGCWKADSFMVYNSLSVSLPSNQSICPPIAYTIAPTSTLTAAGLTYSWQLNGSTISGATTSSYQATQDGTYKLTVTSGSCGSTSASMIITSPTSPLAGTVSCASGSYQFSATSGTYNVINSASSVAWYTVPSGGTALASNPNSISATAPSASLVASPGCTIGGLYAQDLNSFSTTLGPTSLPCSASSITTQGNTAGAMMITVYDNVTINSLQIVQQNYSTGGNATYAVQILSNSPGSGPYSGSCNCNTDGPGSVIAAATGPTYTFPQTTTPTARTLDVGPSGNGYTLTGSASGTKYWIQISGSEYGYLTCGATYPYSNTPNPGVVQLTEQLIYGSISTQMQAFNLQFTEGTPNPCSRTWVCANTSCPAPVKFMYINVQNEGQENIISWATAAELNNKFFVVERSTDANNFISIDTIAGAGNSNSIREYTYTDDYTYNGTVYYQIKQVDDNGDYTYSEMAAVNMQNSSPARVYPVPVTNGQNLNINFTSNMEGTITIDILDMAGKEIQKTVKVVERGDNIISIFTDNLAKGVYIIEMFAQNGEKTIDRIVVN